ncbi:MAG: putative multidrug ABC transporter ATP-binding protein YbhF [Anaerolineales bacterium]|nr:putative multidrug ABC transporter ATP-binding protein YbhF [Anaerolineales bacterium]
MTLADMVVRTEGLSKIFSSQQQGEVVAVAGLDLAVPRGETFGLIGPDGAGKTTTTRLLVGLLRPTRGQATVLGYDTLREAMQLKRRIGYMAQRFSLYGDLTVMENLRFFANVHEVSAESQRKRIPELLRFAGLEGFGDRLGNQLSGGMKKKLALAGMLIHNPEVVFLDEPTLGVDPTSRREFWDLLAALRMEQGLTIFVCTPYMDEAERCHRVGLIYEGRVVAQGTPREIARRVPGQLLDCRPSNFERAKSLADGLPGVLEIQTLGDRLRLFVDDAASRVPEIREAMARHGVTTGELRVVQPGMEEAFISLVQRQTGAQNLGSEIRVGE